MSGFLGCRMSNQRSEVEVKANTVGFTKGEGPGLKSRICVRGSTGMAIDEMSVDGACYRYPPPRRQMRHW